MTDRAKMALAVVMVAALAYVVYSQVSGGSLLPGSNLQQPPAELDTERLDELREVASVQQVAVLGGMTTYDLGGRNLFQYGPPKPPPPTPEELEARRRAEEERLRAMEEEARRRAEQQKRLKEEQERRAREAMETLEAQREAQKDQAPAAPRKVPPPPINLKLVGYVGPHRSRIAVFLRGNEIVLGKRGEVIEGKFKVLSMGPESVMMGYVDPAHQNATKRIDLGS